MSTVYQAGIIALSTLLALALTVMDLSMKLDFLIIETVHTMVVLFIFASALFYLRRNPRMKQYGWNFILWGLGLLLLGSIVDFFDDPPRVAWLQSLGMTGTFAWQSALFKKLLGYTAGVILVSIGVFQLLPLLIRVRSEFLAITQRINVLSQREKDVLRIAASGHSNQKIAEALKVSPRTVDTHLYRIYQKVGVNNRTEAIILALESGLL